MIKRVTVKGGEGGEPVQVIPPEGESLSGPFEFTILNTDEAKKVELVDSEGTTFGKGFPLAPNAAWSGVVGPAEKMWVIAGDASAISVAIIGVAVPA